MKSNMHRALWPLVLPLLVAADGPSSPSILAVMHKQYTVSRAPFKVIGKELAAPSPDWQTVRDAGDKFKELASFLGKKSPGRGSEESWRQLIGLNMADAEAMIEATKGHELAPLRDAHRRIAASCKACHDAHRYRARAPN